MADRKIADRKIADRKIADRKMADRKMADWESENYESLDRIIPFTSFCRMFVVYGGRPTDRRREVARAGNEATPRRDCR
ncbi:MAG: hypothetical protein MOB07_02395 [Acidobacteria bacterium]|nr:hypothetical protein [Acidobacteriota bacterium]